MDLRKLQKAYLAEARAVTDLRLHVGALIRTILSEDDGLRLVGRKEKPKRLVIIGIDKTNGLCYGSILVNTRMNPRAGYSDQYLAAQYMLRQADYPDFLDYDSYADCGELFAIPILKLKAGQYFGQLTPDDLSGIFTLLETTPTLSTKQKKRFGIRRR